MPVSLPTSEWPGAAWWLLKKNVMKTRFFSQHDISFPTDCQFSYIPIKLLKKQPLKEL